MKKSKFTEKQIIQMLKEFDSGVKIDDICRQYGISCATLYKWRSKYANMSESDLKKLRALEHENSKLKKMYAELSLDNQALKEIVAKKF